MGPESPDENSELGGAEFQVPGSKFDRILNVALSQPEVLVPTTASPPMLDPEIERKQYATNWLRVFFSE